MILYLDTSALLKLYVEEEGSQLVRNTVHLAEDSLTSIVTYAEARAALSRARRERVITRASHFTAVEQLDADWSKYTAVQASESIVRRAGSLAEKHGLRGFDAIHLASAIEGTRDIHQPWFACFDRRLNRAARREGFEILGQTPRRS